MIVRCFGARGSIPVSGPEYVRFGGDSTCIELRSAADEVLVVDAGSGIRRLGKRLLAEGRLRLTMLFTHSHWDHILGFPFFKPIYDERAEIDIHGCPLEQGDMRKLLAETMNPPHFPVPFDQLAARLTYHAEASCALKVGGIEVTSIPLSHPNLGAGYRFSEGGKSFVLLTDNELAHRHRGGRSFEEYADFARGADLLFHDAEFTPEEYPSRRGWGHSTHIDAVDLAIAAGVRRFGLVHHNQDRGDEEVAALVEDCRVRVAAAGLDMEVFGATQETEVALQPALPRP